MPDLFTHQFIARENLVGMGIEALGVCYLAYDLLGGKEGPLRLLTRAASYTTLFFIGYFIVLGLRYALVASIGMGIALVVEYRIAQVKPGWSENNRLGISGFGFIRGLILGLAGMTIAGPAFGAIFGLVSGLGLAISYWFGFAPTDDYRSESRPRMDSHKIVATCLRSVAVAIGGVLAGLLVPSAHHWTFGFRLGFAAGMVSALIGVLSPAIEWWIETVSARKLGVFGLGLIFLGMAVQSAQYWMVVFEIPIQ